MLTRLVLTRKAEIASELLQGDMAYLPIFDIDDNSNEVLWELWIEGFARAVVLSDKEWDVLFDTGDEDLAAAAMGILMYVARAGGIDVGDAPLDEDVPPEVMIPYLVETLYRCQNGLPRIAMDSPGDGSMQPVVRPKIGRNSPCPCGSGRKFKKCCGAN